MTYFINEVEIKELIDQRNNINLAIEYLLRKELKMKGHKITEEEIEEERMNLYYYVDRIEAVEAMLTNEFILNSIYWQLVDED